jgi:hypothetical protein
VSCGVDEMAMTCCDLLLPDLMAVMIKTVAPRWVETLNPEPETRNPKP